MLLLSLAARHVLSGELREDIQRQIAVMVFTASSVCLFLGLSWVRKAVLVILIPMTFGMVLTGVVQTFHEGVDIVPYPLGLSIGMIILTWGLWRDPDGPFSKMVRPPIQPEDSVPGDPKKPMVSLVQLRSRQRYLEPVVIAHALTSAWGVKIANHADSAEDAEGFVGGNGPTYVIILLKPVMALFTLHNHEAPYFDEVDAFADKVPNLRFADVIRRHQAWLAIDLMDISGDSLMQVEAYRMLGKAIAALADDETLAIYCPQHNHFNLWSPELEEVLCGDSPLSAFAEEVKAPVIGVGSDTAMDEAIAEARRRWPEFVALFQARKPGDPGFIVKAPFTSEDDEREHMWVEVFGLEPEYVHGNLINEPFHCKRLKLGSQVEVKVAEISDWLCSNGQGGALGGFTTKIVSKAAQS